MSPRQMAAFLRLPAERQKSVYLPENAIWLALFECLLNGIMAKSELLAQAKGAVNDYLLQINTSSDEQVCVRTSTPRGVGFA
jgi:hypothetical protein